jgi:hypothetical protein
VRRGLLASQQREAAGGLAEPQVIVEVRNECRDMRTHEVGVRAGAPAVERGEPSFEPLRTHRGCRLALPRVRQRRPRQRDRERSAQETTSVHHHFESPVLMIVATTTAAALAAD